jgi:hypothetical protein
VAPAPVRKPRRPNTAAWDRDFRRISIARFSFHGAVRLTRRTPQTCAQKYCGDNVTGGSRGNECCVNCVAEFRVGLADLRQAGHEFPVGALRASVWTFVGISDGCAAPRRHVAEFDVEAEMMNRVAVKSKMLRSVGYEAEKKILELEFEAGTVYRYYDVPEFTFRALMHADSKHAFFTASIEGRYRCEEIRPGA